ncbi:MAG TPA: adenylate/guanylate cyclase domain-containing protein [Spirochaetia bacterium]|nr:adenylate/guanylate cyclase domain-containing protein [Spirochaetia bacterium]
MEDLHREHRIVSTLNERQMAVEHQINFVRMGLIGIAVVLDAITAASQHLVTNEYMAFDAGVILLSAAYLTVVHLFSRGRSYHWWLKYLSITLDFALVMAYVNEMRLPNFAAKVSIETTVSLTTIIIIVLVMLSAVRLSRAAVLYGAVVGTLLVSVVTLGFSHNAVSRIWLPAFVLIAGAITYWISANTRHVVRDLLRRERLHRFLPKELVKIVEDSDLEVTLGGRATRVTVLFSDIRNFTRFSESRSPQEVVGILNEYFTVMSGAVHRNGGMIDKYIGDAVMAIFGAPMEREDDAGRAVAAAGEMIRELQELNERWKLWGREPIAIGIALHTGVAVAGNIGAPDRMDYTVIGDTVNLTARLEELNKKYGTHFLMSEDTYREVSGQVQADFVAETDIRGREKPVKIYTLR